MGTDLPMTVTFKDSAHVLPGNYINEGSYLVRLSERAFDPHLKLRFCGRGQGLWVHLEREIFSILLSNLGDIDILYRFHDRVHTA